MIDKIFQEIYSCAKIFKDLKSKFRLFFPARSDRR